MKTFCISLPFFDGFYESPYYNGDTVYNEIIDNSDYYKEQYGTDEPDDFELDSEAYNNEIVNRFCTLFKEVSPDFVTEVTLLNIVSPKYYNYSTDTIDALVTMSDGWKERLLDFLKDNETWLKDKIKKDWSDKPGFWSFISNDYNDWVMELKKTDENDIDVRIITELLAYIMVHNYGKDYNTFKFDNFIYPIIEDIYIGNYIDCIKK